MYGSHVDKRFKIFQQKQSFDWHAEKKVKLESSVCKYFMKCACFYIFLSLNTNSILITRDITLHLHWKSVLHIEGPIAYSKKYVKVLDLICLSCQLCYIYWHSYEYQLTWYTDILVKRKSLHVNCNSCDFDLVVGGGGIMMVYVISDGSNRIHHELIHVG